MTKYNELARIIANEQLSLNQYCLSLEAPRISEEILPGQFVHLLLPRFNDHILRRPFSVLNTDPTKGTIDILYQCVGTGSTHMASLKPGEEVQCLGPLGSSWSEVPAGSRALLVGGGVGAAPLYLQAQRLIKSACKLDVLLGAQTKEVLTLKDWYKQLELNELRFATDDGSFGTHGFVTACVEELLQTERYDYLACCGPEPMMQAVARLAQGNIPVMEVSLERRMACGLGACLTCVVDTRHGKQRACSEGPIFKVGDLLWL